MLTEAVLAHVCPRLPAGQRARFVPELTRAFIGSSITTPARLAAFLAQAAHESGEFRYLREIWGPTPAQRRYEFPSDLAARLGNTHPGDGFKYRGGGLFQLTGRANYRTTGERTGLPLEADPDTIEELRPACITAVDFWESRHFSVLADLETQEGFRVMCRRLNGGPNGLPQREDYHAVARAVLGLPDVKA